MNADFWFWIAFNAGVLCILAIDLFGFHRKAHRPTFHWALYVFGVFLVLTGLRMFWHKTKQVDFKNHLLVRITRRFVPITDRYHGSKFSVRLQEGRRVLTPLGLSLIAKRERARVGPGVKSNRDFLPVAKQPAGN